VVKNYVLRIEAEIRNTQYISFAGEGGEADNSAGEVRGWEGCDKEAFRGDSGPGYAGVG
jgi:hypothetical protein